MLILDKFIFRNFPSSFFFDVIKNKREKMTPLRGDSHHERKHARSLVVRFISETEA